MVGSVEQDKGIYFLGYVYRLRKPKRTRAQTYFNCPIKDQHIP